MSVLRLCLAAIVLVLIAPLPASASGFNLFWRRAAVPCAGPQGCAVASFSGNLGARSQPVEHRSGGDPSTSHKSPGRSKYEIITLERGLTQDEKFYDWAASAHGAEDFTLETFDDNHKRTKVQQLHGCRVAEFHGGPQKRSIDSITLHCDSVTEG
jgi:hypothetical protein